jgi:6-phosphogluconate dehydrogenase (decarboxylating)
MKLGMIGLGRMGGNMVKRLEQDGHEVVTYTRSGGGTASTIEELVSGLEPPRVAWMMVPAGDATEAGTRTSATRSAATARPARRGFASRTPACRAGSGASRSATA